MDFLESNGDLNLSTARNDYIYSDADVSSEGKSEHNHDRKSTSSIPGNSGLGICLYYLLRIEALQVQAMVDTRGCFIKLVIPPRYLEIESRVQTNAMLGARRPVYED
jgi:hypothetical protein